MDQKACGVCGRLSLNAGRGGVCKRGWSFNCMAWKRGVERDAGRGNGVMIECILLLSDQGSRPYAYWECVVGLLWALMGI